MKQAATTWQGKALLRWYVYQADGQRYVVWEETAESALAKVRESAAGLLVRVEPAPPLGESE